LYVINATPTIETTQPFTTSIRHRYLRLQPHCAFACLQTKGGRI
jgi:hypothetical protein